MAPYGRGTWCRLSSCDHPSSGCAMRAWWIWGRGRVSPGSLSRLLRLHPGSLSWRAAVEGHLSSVLWSGNSRWTMRRSSTSGSRSGARGRKQMSSWPGRWRTRRGLPPWWLTFWPLTASCWSLSPRPVARRGSNAARGPRDTPSGSPFPTHETPGVEIYSGKAWLLRAITRTHPQAVAKTARSA